MFQRKSSNDDFVIYLHSILCPSKYLWHSFKWTKEAETNAVNLFPFFFMKEIVFSLPFFAFHLINLDGLFVYDFAHLSNACVCIRLFVGLFCVVTRLCETSNVTICYDFDQNAAVRQIYGWLKCLFSLIFHLLAQSQVAIGYNTNRLRLQK